MTSETAFSIAMMAGWLALVVFLVWPVGHICHDATCTRDQIIKKGDK